MAESAPEGSEQAECLIFKVTGSLYAIENIYIKEIIRISGITPVPCTPPFVSGLINLRGDIYSVINIHILLEQKKSGISDLSKVIIISSGDVTFGMNCDDLCGFCSSGEFNELLPSNFPELDKELIKGISKEGVRLLDGSKLIKNKKIIIE